MKLKDKKGSISIFVLVALLFMTAFLILLYSANVNKSKIIQEQFETINEIYSVDTSNAYEQAYTNLRKKNKQTMNASVENTSDIELTKTFNGKLSNYRIYGNSVKYTDTIQSLGYNLSRVKKSTSNLIHTFNDGVYETYSGQNNLSAEDRRIYIGDYPVGTKFYVSQRINFETFYVENAEAVSVRDINYNPLTDSDIAIFDTSVGSNNYSYSQFYQWEHIWYRTYIEGKNESYFIKNNENIAYMGYNHKTSNGDFTTADDRIVSVEYVGDTDKSIGKCRIPVRVTNENEESTTIYIYMDEPLRKVGDKADYIDFKEKKIYRYINVIDDTGTKSIEESFEILAEPKKEDINLPEILTFEDYTKIELLTSLIPSKIELEYEGYTLD